MIIIPPEEIIDYITTDEDGKWICLPSMPEELLPLFDEFLRAIKDAQKQRWDGEIEKFRADEERN